MRVLGIALAVVVLGSGAGAVDPVVARAGEPALPLAPYSYDDTLELKYDSGVALWWQIWVSGEGHWLGYDFDISTISSYAIVQAIKVQSRGDWPNSAWDGFRLGVYAFSGGLPGSLLWGPTYVVPTGTIGWKEFSVDWVLPYGVTKFVAAQEQYNNYPSCEPYAIDNNPTAVGHPWVLSGGTWTSFYNSETAPYRNLMIRVIMASTSGVAPQSLGRVKALYH
jgi:hypothetical protein